MLAVSPEEDEIWRKIRRFCLYNRGAEPDPARVASIAAAMESFMARPPPDLKPTPPAEPAVELDPTSLDLGWMTPVEIADAAGATRLAREKGIGSLRSALAWYVLHRPVATESDLPSAIYDFILGKLCERVREQTLRYHYQILRRFAFDFEGRLLTTIRSEEMARYLMRWPNLTTRRSLWQVLASFFSWAQRMNLVSENPVMLAMRKPRPTLPERHVLTVDETRHLLRQAIKNKTIVYWALSLFAGLRTDEVRLLQGLEHPWQNLNLEAGTIDLRDQPSKVWPRIVPILPVLDAWLRWAKARNYRVMAGDFSRRFREDRFTVLRQHYPPEFFLKRPHWVPAGAVANIGRRTYISCRLALPHASFAEVSSDVGNSEYNIRVYYYQKVSREHALEHFTLTPDKL
jgi:integrase